MVLIAAQDSFVAPWKTKVSHSPCLELPSPISHQTHGQTYLATAPLQQLELVRQQLRDDDGNAAKIQATRNFDRVNMHEVMVSLLILMLSTCTGVGKSQRCVSTARTARSSS